ncbi:adhesion G -coupled receptor E2-like protein [Labeo rohita]|uniref:Adhesion G-coupled receptor E2-like protein n=1 Tax=Labeo rohita TaxID=84645 RepID=A0A498NDJ4_LABRO|nr:adhesion G -coupled receptor E2-like protein [Labeo rohita]
MQTTCGYGYITRKGKCEELNCDTLLSENKASQASPKLTKLVSLMTKICLVLTQSLLLSLTENTPKQTACGYGYRKKKGKCEDDNECESDPLICGRNANCFNTDGSFYCQCDGGFTPTHNFTQAHAFQCKDINECVDGSAVCGSNAQCVNSEGGYNCTCETGYISSNGKDLFKSGQGVQCIDDNECESDPPICGENAICFNTDGSYYCQCDGGFTPTHNFTQADSIECKDINECVDGSAVCGSNAECVNSEGGYNCTCETGYISSNGKDLFKSGQGVQCIVKGVCEIDKSICGGGVCKNSKDGHECVCSSGFTNYGHKQMKCTELKCDTLLSENKASQASPKLTKLVSLMTNSCLVLSQSESVQNNTQVDGEKLLKEFLSELDDLPHGGFNGDNYIISALLRIVVIILKLIGHLLSASRIRKISAKAGVELLVKNGSSSPEGHFLMNISGAQLTSQLDTATGDTNLGFMTAVLFSYKVLWLNYFLTVRCLTIPVEMVNVRGMHGYRLL